MQTILEIWDILSDVSVWSGSFIKKKKKKKKL